MKLLILIFIVGWAQAQNQIADAPKDQPKNMALNLEKMRPRSVNIYINQHDTIELPEDIEKISIAPSVCDFNFKRPLLKPVVEVNVSSNSKNAKESLLLTRLRTISDENMEWVGVTGQFVYALSNTTTMSVFTSKDLVHITNYELSQRKSEHMPFIMNNDAILVMEDGIFMCNDTAKRVMPNPKSVQGNGLQISQKQFLIYKPSELIVYTYDGQQFKIKEIIGKAIMKKAETNWIKCKKINQYVFCLDNHHGLFRFDPEHMTNYNEISKKTGCLDFLITPSPQGDVTLLQCMFNGEAFLHHQPPIVKSEYLPHYIHDLSMIPDIDNYTVFVKKSTLMFQNLVHREQVSTQGTLQPIIKLVMRKEDNNTYFYILYKDRIAKKMLTFTKPSLTCYSMEPVSLAEDVRLVTTSGQQKIMPIRISIVEQKIMTPNKNVLIIGLMLIVVGLIIFIGIIYHYEKVERSVSLIYRSHRLREQNKKKQSAAPI